MYKHRHLTAAISTGLGDTPFLRKSFTKMQLPYQAQASITVTVPPLFQKPASTMLLTTWRRDIKGEATKTAFKA